MSDAVLVYDADCGFCRWCVARVLGLDRDRRVRPVALQSEEGRRLTAALEPQVAEASWHLATADGRLLSAGAVVPELADLLPRGGAVASLARRVPGTIDRAYRFGAGHRDRFGAVTRRVGDADGDRARIARRA